MIGRALESLSLLPFEEKPSEVVIVDNASSDNTISIVTNCNLQTKIILNEHNLGLSKANNIGAAQAEGDSLFFLNPDVELMPGAVTILQSFQEKNPEAAIIGPAMVDGNGVRQSTARTWPSPLVIASRRTPLGRTAWGRKISSNHMNRFNSSCIPLKPHWLVGAAMWLTPGGREKVGLMSEKYFLYFEDVEWCWRTWQRGMEVWYEPRAVIKHVCHRESASRGTTLNLHLKSMLLFLTTHPRVLFGTGPGRNQ
ncbi:MAG: glycosyltransferase family 2 protein [Candidatus Aegiribacteria sp.]|nr:glycosyltransferase family 2 protein [Candidatus Aegiribacteria sp.]